MKEHPFPFDKRVTVRQVLPGTLLALFLAALTVYGYFFKPSTLLQDLWEEDQLLSAIQTDYVKVLEAGKNAVLAANDEAATPFAEQARRSTADIEAKRQALETLIDRGNASKDQQSLREFNACWTQFQALNTTILDLAAQNTNVKAQRLSSAEGLRDVREIEHHLNALINNRRGDDRVFRLAYQAITASLNILVLHNPHIQASRDEVMDNLEGEISRYDQSARQALRELHALSDASGREELQKVDEAYDRFMGHTAEVLKLSRLNTNLKSIELSWGKQSAISAQCQDVITTLQSSVRAQQSGGTK